MTKRNPLDPLRYGRAQRWKVDFDEEYIKSLSPSDREWLEKFCVAEYDGESTGLHNETQMREVWRNRYKAANDVMNIASPMTEGPDPVDRSPSPEDQAIVSDTKAHRIRQRKKRPAEK